MKKSVTTLGMLTGFGLAATLFLGCQDFVGGKDDGAHAAKTAEDGAVDQPGSATLSIERSPVGEAAQAGSQTTASLYTEKPTVSEQTVAADLPGNVQASPPANPSLDSLCREISIGITAAKNETNAALRDSLYNAGMAVWVALDCNSLAPPPPYVSPEQKCSDARYQLERTEARGDGPGTKYYQTWLDEVNKYCGATP